MGNIMITVLAQLSYIVNAYENGMCGEKTDFTDMIMRLRFENNDAEELLRDLVMYSMLLSEISDEKLSEMDLDYLENIVWSRGQ